MNSLGAGLTSIWPRRRILIVSSRLAYSAGTVISPSAGIDNTLEIARSDRSVLERV